jgi:hypothetical protein
MTDTKVAGADIGTDSTVGNRNPELATTNPVVPARATGPEDPPQQQWQANRHQQSLALSRSIPKP